MGGIHPVAGLDKHNCHGRESGFATVLIGERRRLPAQRSGVLLRAYAQSLASLCDGRALPRIKNCTFGFELIGSSLH